MRVLKMHLGIYTDLGCNGIRTIDCPGYFIPRDAVTSDKAEEYKKELDGFILKWFDGKHVDAVEGMPTWG